MAVTINASTSAGAVTTADTSGVLQLQTGGTAALTVDASQNVGIGTASPSARLSVSDTADPKINLLVGSTERAFISYTTATTTASFDSDADITLSPNNTVAVRANAAGVLQFNSGYGSVATAYGCRAWVNFDGVGTVAIRASGNVSSITDNGTGDYTVNFTTAMPDVNYAGVWGGTGINVYPALGIGDLSWVTTTSIRGRYFAGTTQTDLASVNLAVFR